MKFEMPYELVLGWRYTRAGRATRRNGFISFISGVSMLGIGLGVAALVIVLSVMNGFQKEVRDRMLSVVSHIEIVSADGGALEDLAGTLQQVKLNNQVLGAAPFISAQALLARGEDMKGVLVRGIDPALEPSVVDLTAGMAAQARNSINRGLSMPGIEALQPGQFGVVLGLDLARQLGLRIGDPVTLIAPNGQVTPAGVLPRLKQMQVVGLFNSGHYEYDSALAMLHVADASKIFRLEGPTGIRLKIKDLHEARAVAKELAPALPMGMAVRATSQPLLPFSSLSNIVVIPSSEMLRICTGRALGLR